MSNELNINQFIKETFESNGFTLNEVQIDQFAKYLNYLKQENEKFNITAITDDKEIVIKHFLDSVMVTKYIDFNSINSLIDIGTGGGFPGVPIKILYPNLNITLVDSLNKRINFLNELTKLLNLNNIKAIHARSEELGQNEEYREKYDIAISRAVAYLNTLAEWCIPFVKQDGYFISLKKDEYEEELNESKNAIKILKGKVERIESYNYTYEEKSSSKEKNDSKTTSNNEENNNIEIFHSIIFIKKEESTPNKYPRPNKQIKNNPL